MDQIMNYIFGGLQRCDENFYQIEKAFRAQNRLNKLMAITMLMSTYTCYSAYKVNRSKIESLKKEIEQLKAQQDPIETAE